MALASFKSAKSVAQLSESPVYHYQYSSLTAAATNLAKTDKAREERRKSLQKLFLERFGVKPVRDWQSDGVSLLREHSKCLKDLQYVYKANAVIPGNKPVGIGYPLLFINLADFASKWSLPFAVDIVGPETDYVSFAPEKFRVLCSREEFQNVLHVNTADGSFGCPKYLSPTSGIENLASLTRLRHGRKVCFAKRKKTLGAP